MGRRNLQLRGSAPKRGVMRVARRDYNKWNNISGYIDPVPDFLRRYHLDGTDVSLVPVNSPTIVAGVALPDETASSFNGVDQRYNGVADSSIFATIGSGAYSIAVWIKVVAGVTQRLIATATSTADGFEIFRQSGGTIQLAYNGSGNDFRTTAVDDGSWHHVAWTCLGTGQAPIVYTDGAQTRVGSPRAYSFIDTGVFNIGGSSANNAQLVGELDDIRFYDRAMTPAEITLLFNDKA